MLNLMAFGGFAQHLSVGFRIRSGMTDAVMLNLIQHLKFGMTSLI